MNNIFKFKTASVCLLICGSAFAGDPVTISVTGNVIASPCEIRSDSVNQTIDLGNGTPLQSADLQNAGASSDWVKFDIGLVNCPKGTSKATVQFHGTADANNPGDMYKNTGSAENIAIQLQSVKGDQLGDNKVFTGVVVNNAYTYNLRVRAYSQNGNVTSGTIRASVTATFTYQ